MLKRYTRRFPHALCGIAYALQSDFGFRTQVYGLGIILSFIAYLLSPLSANEFLFLLLAFVIILITELQNSALEMALDHLHPEIHDAIKKSKDMAAGAVLIAGFLLVIVISSLVYTRLAVIQNLF